MNDWDKHLQRRQAVANAVYLVLFALAGTLVVLAVLYGLGYRW